MSSRCGLAKAPTCKPENVSLKVSKNSLWDNITLCEKEDGIRCMQYDADKADSLFINASQTDASGMKMKDYTSNACHISALSQLSKNDYKCYIYSDNNEQTQQAINTHSDIIQQKCKNIVYFDGNVDDIKKNRSCKDWF